MKKIYFFVLIFSLSIPVFSQNKCVSCTGLSTNFYSQCERSEDGFGLLVVADTINSPLNNPDPKDPYPGFYAPYKYEDNELKFNITSATGLVAPITIEFGKNFGSKNSDSIYTIDLSGDASFDLFMRNYSNTDLKVKLSLQDINDSIVNCYPSVLTGMPFNPLIENRISRKYTNPGELKWTGIGVKSFENAVNLSYEHNSEPNQTQCSWTTNKALISNKFDFTKVKRILITIINARDTGPNCYAPEALDNVLVGIQHFKLGYFTTPENPLDYYDYTYEQCTNALNIKKENNPAKIQVSPNPATEKATISYNVQSRATVKIYDMIGALVKTESGDNKQTTINTSNLKTGVYLLAVEADGIVLQGEKLVIK